MMRLAKPARFLVLLLCLAAAGCAGRGQRLADTVPVLGAPDAGTYAQSATEELRIGPQDRLSIAIYPAREMSLPSVRVGVDGTILVPAVGTVTAQGKTPPELAQELQRQLGECCLQRPQVVVQIEETLSRRIAVMGAVKTSGVHNLSGRATLMQAISMAGGVDTATANMKAVGIIRTVNGQRAGKVFNLVDIQAGRAEDPEVFGGDQIIVDTSDSKTAWRNFISAIPLTSFFAVF